MQVIGKSLGSKKKLFEEFSIPRARIDVLKVAQRPPRRSEAQNIAKRFRKHADHYFRFLETTGIDEQRDGTTFPICGD